MAKIATVLTDYVEDVEYTAPANDFKREGHEVVTIDEESGKSIKGKQGMTIKIDEGIDDVSPDDFDALLIPGGFSPDILRGDERFVKFAKAFMDAKKPVFAICHGPQLLITAKALEGRDVTGYQSIQVDLEYAAGHVKDEEVVVCQNQLVTSRQPDDIPAFIKESLNLLK
ncbi:ThiJ/PfpI family protein [Gracilibacillus halophilus YIM-C55.5]|uniref:ThiJ/PfpI family protein n=2 Tax=Gracilibacillus TaxID=74385 RepID=N4WNU8_9BACI|nr:ThiJ/PfpI family protein [Gracilibacillus halophilus YIM-C55.5]